MSTNIATCCALQCPGHNIYKCGPSCINVMFYLWLFPLSQTLPSAEYECSTTEMFEFFMGLQAVAFPRLEFLSPMAVEKQLEEHLQEENLILTFSANTFPYPKPFYRLKTSISRPVGKKIRKSLFPLESYIQN